MNLSLVDSLPAFGIAGRLNDVLAQHNCAVVTAPPGAGKSTVLPLTILEGLASKGKILMLEPRRLAARQIAERMAFLIGEPVGRTVGYRVRFENKVSSATRIEVLTEGILTRMLVADPTLEGVDAVIFDEYHERSLASDLALALTRESQSILRPDLKLVVMSATIDTDTICKALNAPLVESEGRMFPVEIVHAPAKEGTDVAEAVAHAVRVAHRDQEGDILAFLPGEGEIRRCAEMLEGALGSTALCPLYGLLPPEDQRRAIAPSAPGQRKVVLATPIAETSITIEGVRVVVDSGLCRKMVFDPQSSLSRLDTVRISMDMARQRTGRAGRTAPGVCYRLWSKATENTMADCRTPEVLDADLASTVLDIAAWGGADASALPWLTVPPKAHLAQAARLLEALGATDATGRITAHGRELAKLPCHPRVAQMLVRADSPELKALAADIAALLEEKDPLQAGADFALRVSQLRRSRKARGAWGRIVKIAGQYRSLVKVEEDNSDPNPYYIGMLLASAYPERIAKAQPEGCGHYLLASGEPAFVEASDDMSAYTWLAVAAMNQRQGAEGRIFLAGPLDVADVLGSAKVLDNVSWDSRSGCALARREWRLGKLVADARAIDVPRERLAEVICAAAAKEGTAMFDFNEDVGNLQRRVAAVAVWHPELELPDLGTEAVLAKASEWLPMYLGKATTKAELKKIDLTEALWGMLSYEQQQSVERLAPARITVPTGNHIRLEYRLGAEAPVLRVRLQECFGLLDTPCVDGGKRPILMELLSPGYKPVQLTQDLRSFWQGTYFEVRKELKRRYPKHSWPDDPIAAEATARAKKSK